MNVLEIAIFCLALNVYHESRGEPLEGQYAVAQTTMNRAGYDRKKVCQVVVADRQFSWTIRGVWWLAEKPYLNPSFRPKEGFAWQVAQRVAKDLLARRVDVVGDAVFFHAFSVNPDWSSHPKVEYVKTIGGHHFYRNASYSAN